MKKKFKLLIISSSLILCLPVGFLSAQNYYWVEFTDKNGTPFQIKEPEAFLSERAIERRKHFDVPITEEDLPVSPVYLDSLRQNGIGVQHTSRWLNAATVVAEKKKLSLIKAFPFVDTVFFVGRFHSKNKGNRGSPSFDDSLRTPKLADSPYGYGAEPLQILKGDYLHEKGYKGQEKLIAVLDGGFSQVDVIPFFDSLRSDRRLLGQYDFVDRDTNVFESTAHGTKVLSTMAANIPGLIVGTAPEAQYFLIKTEDVRSEFTVEECHWIAGLEFADSLGADITTTSLGYSTFSDSKLNYEYEDLNGVNSLACQAAEKAFARGLLTLVSAGNEGYTSWKYVTVPGDSKHVLTVGASDFRGRKASFSSFGPTADGRIKPDIAGPGVRISVSGINAYRVNTSSGTSISTPIICGLVACLWQAFPDKTNEEVMDAVRQSANQYKKPDNRLGYGVPDFQKAFEILSEMEKE